MVDTIAEDSTRTFYLLDEKTIFKVLWGKSGGRDTATIEYHLKSEFDLATISLDMYWKDEMVRKVVIPGVAVREQTAMTMKKVVVGAFPVRSVKDWRNLEIILMAKDTEKGIQEEALLPSEFWDLAT